LLAQNVGGVSHFVANLGDVIRDGLERYGEDGFRPGDVIITNHQRVGGQHLNNILIYTPCFERSQIAANRLAERRLEEILLRYGRAIVEQAIERIFDQTEASCRAVVADLPDGVYEAQSLFAGSPLDRNQPVEIKVRVIIHGGDMTIDLTECSRSAGPRSTRGHSRRR